MSAASPGITIRSFRPADAPAVRAIFARGQLDFAEGTPLEDEARAYVQRSLDADLSDIPACYMEPPGSHFWVAERGGVIVGMVGVQRVNAEEAELRRMSVAADSRRQGNRPPVAPNRRGLLPAGRLHSGRSLHGHPP